MGGRSLRALGAVGLTNHEKALSQGSFRLLMWHNVSTTRNPHFLLSSSHQGGTGVGEYLVKGELGIWPHWAPSSGYQHSHWFPWGEWPTWLRPGKWQKWAMQPFISTLALLSVTIYSCVYMSPKHIFLHQMYRNAIRTISTPDQFTHMLPPTG